MSKKILGLDLGTNSIGWALVEQDFENKHGKILGMGSRIIPMDEKILGEFGKGNSISQTAKRTDYRSKRRLYERNHLRRERLHRVLNVLGFLPEHYSNDIDFEKCFGKFKNETETKLVWKKNGKKDNGKDRFEFTFQSTFKEMLDEFKKSQPDLLNRKNRKNEDVKIPCDWTIYYLRKKALTNKISKEELAWLILNFNQKRGYYQLRGEEEEENTNDKKEFVALLKITNVEKGEVDKKNDKKTWYIITFVNGWKHPFPFISEPTWLNTEREFLIVEEYDDDGNIKIVKDRKKDTEGREKRTISSLPSFEEIDLMSKKDQDKIYKKIKARTEITITKSGKTVGTYIYEKLLQNPTQKIRGKFVRTIERKFYKDELKAILEKQIALQPELFTDDLYNDCVRELYRSNEAHQLQLSKRDFVHLFLDDIIFYQRPLRSQKSSIGNCSLEYRKYKSKDKDGKEIEIKEYLKAIPKSNPYYNEFRVWQWLYNLKIYTKADDNEVTIQFLKSTEEREKLFEFLMSKKEVNHKDILDYFITPLTKEKFPKAKSKLLNDEIKKEVAKYRWNYVFDDLKEKEDEKSKAYPMNETGYEIRRLLEKVENVPADFLKTISTKEITNKKTKVKELISLDTREYQLWHIIYSITDKNEFETALETFARKHSLYYVSKSERDNKNPDKKCFVENFKKLVWREKDYGSYSEKAIKKLLPLMRLGKYWDENAIVENSANYFGNIQRLIEKLNIKSDAITEKEKKDWNKSINRKLYDELSGFLDADVASFQGLQLHIAQYVVYGRHSEAGNIDHWKMSHDIQDYLYRFKQHSLRNPIVEQVITETLRTVKDIWEHYAEKNSIPYEMIFDEHKKKKVRNYNKFFDEIHIELGREMKNTAEDRKEMTKQISENENTNLRIKAMLIEFANDDSFKNQIDYSSYCKDEKDLVSFQKGNNPVRAYSQTQYDILKIYEECILKNHTEQDLKNEKTGLTETKDGKTKDVTIYDISQKSQPTKNQIEKYKLWLEQKYCSPYTGQMISLTKLFTPAYEIEHIIPKSRYFDDSLSNKVICEEAVNKLKDNKLGLEFIKNPGLQTVEIGMGKHVNIFTVDEYKKFVEEHYSKNKAKRSKLLLEEIPDKMIARQMNDTRYISKFVSQLLSNIVRNDNDGSSDDGVNSKNLIPGNGKITTRLKQDWGLNDVWNELILPRFERMNDLTKTTAFTATNKEGHTIPTIPPELSKGFQKKRIDHRHHALDALVITCATRDHVNLLNNQSAKSDNSRYDLQNKLRNSGKWTDNNGKERDKFTSFKMPWKTFTIDAKKELDKIVVSFKQNLRVINKATNTYQKFENGKKIEKKQEGENWAIRKPMHEETISGIVELPWLKVGEGEFTTATRKILDKSFNKERIKKITDTGIQKILLNYLEEKGGDPELAFSPEEIEELNKNISQYNKGKFHQPIFKVRIYEKGKGRFVLGENGNKKSKYVQGSPNLFYAIYWGSQNQKRSFETIPLNIVIERQKHGLSSVPETNENGDNLCTECSFLSPNDLVYVPTIEEIANNATTDFGNLTSEQRKRIYNVNDFSSACYFTPNPIAKSIAPKEVDLSFDKEKNKLSGSFDTKTASIEGKQIKDICIKLKVDRLGNISPLKKKNSNEAIENKFFVSEPEAVYKKSGLKKFDSFEEMNDADAQSAASIRPLDHLKNTTELIKKIYSDELKDPFDKKIKFK